MIIDSHTHIYPDSTADERKKTTLDNLVFSMNKNEVDKAVVLPIYPQIHNKFIADACRKYPDKLIGFASADPFKADEDFWSDIKKYNLKGIKIHPRIQQVSPCDKKMIKFAKKAASLNLPIIFDCFPQADNNFPIEETFPERIGELARKVTEVKIVMAHAGGYKLWDAFFIARDKPNLYIDFSFSTSYFKGSSIEQDLGFVLKKMGAKRCIYGSDYPEVSLEHSLKNAKEMVKKIGLSTEERQYFFGKTLLSILPSD